MSAFEHTSYIISNCVNHIVDVQAVIALFAMPVCRPHYMHRVDVSYCYSFCRFCGLCVCLLVSNWGELCKLFELIVCHFGRQTCGWNETSIRWGAHWQHLAICTVAMQPYVTFLDHLHVVIRKSVWCLQNVWPNDEPRAQVPWLKACDSRHLTVSLTIWSDMCNTPLVLCGYSYIMKR